MAAWCTWTSDVPRVVEDSGDEELPEEVLSLTLDLPRVATRVGGRLLGFASEWEAVTSDPWVLSVVRFGYRLEFTATPPRPSAVLVTEIPQETGKREALLEELRELLAKNAIVRVQGSSLAGFFSTAFTNQYLHLTVWTIPSSH